MYVKLLLSIRRVYMYMYVKLLLSIRRVYMYVKLLLNHKKDIHVCEAFVKA